MVNIVSTRKSDYENMEVHHMVKYNEILMLTAEDTSQQHIAASVRSSRNKANEVILVANAVNNEWLTDGSMSNEKHGAILF